MSGSLAQSEMFLWKKNLLCQENGIKFMDVYIILFYLMLYYFYMISINPDFHQPHLP